MRTIRLLLILAAVTLLTLAAMLWAYFGVPWSLAGPILLSAVALGLYIISLTWATRQASFKKAFAVVAITTGLLLSLYFLDIPGTGEVTLPLIIIGGTGFLVVWFIRRRRWLKSQ
jgi:hypothetical protein